MAMLTDQFPGSEIALGIQLNGKPQHIDGHLTKENSWREAQVSRAAMNPSEGCWFRGPGGTYVVRVLRDTVRVIVERAYA
ncbi:hypothetical protein ACFQ7W_34645, partial [Streptomyces niveus]